MSPAHDLEACTRLTYDQDLTVRLIRDRSEPRRDDEPERCLGLAYSRRAHELEDAPLRESQTLARRGRGQQRVQSGTVGREARGLT